MDKGPNKDTRKAACKNSEWAYHYALNVDKCFTKETWLAVKGTKYEEKYKKTFNDPIKELII